MKGFLNFLAGLAIGFIGMLLLGGLFNGWGSGEPGSGREVQGSIFNVQSSMFMVQDAGVSHSDDDGSNR